MRAIVLTRQKEGHQVSWGGAFAAGLRRRGWVADLSDKQKGCDLLVMWGARRTPEIARQKAAGGEVCILERGYVGDRFAWTSVSFGGGLNGRAEFRGPFEDGSRWDANFEPVMKPWRDVPGGYALIMQQVPGDKSIEGVDMGSFYRKARAAFEPRGMPVRVRAHPNMHPRQGETHLAAVKASLAQDLAGAHVAVTYNSNSGVDAVLAGVPTVAMDRGAMAWDVTGHELEMPPTPDRTAWAHALAWKQWSREEMESGFCQEAIGL
jgi:hypothetical protein